jgi:hypothetical protein
MKVESDVFRVHQVIVDYPFQPCVISLFMLCTVHIHTIFLFAGMQYAYT